MKYTYSIRSQALFLILFLIFLFASLGHANHSVDNKIRLTSIAALRGETINCIFNDSKGFIWLGSSRGLYRFDGYVIKNYPHSSQDSTSISHNLIQDITEDSRGRIWIATQGGLNYYDYKTDHFVRFTNNPHDSTSMCSNHLQELVIAADGKLWIVAYGGLMSLDIKNHDLSGFSNYVHDPANPKSLPFNKINSIIEDSNGNLWLGSNGIGLIKFNPGKNTFTHIQSRDGNEVPWKVINAPAFLYVDRFLINRPDGKEILWFTFSGKPARLNLSSERLILSRANTGSLSLKDISEVRSFCLDDSETVWMASPENGICIYDSRTDKIKLPEVESPLEFDVKKIQVIYKDHSGNLWFGSAGEGVAVYSKYKYKFHIVPVELEKRPISVTAVLPENSVNSNILWLGSENKGLIRLNLDNNRIKHFPNPHITKTKRINFINQDIFKTDILWIGFYGDGLFSFNKSNGKFIPCNTISAPEDLKDPYRWDLWSTYYPLHFLTDSHKRCWLVSIRGFFQFDPQKSQFIRYMHNPNDSGSIRYNSHYYLAEDSEGCIWIASRNKGLHRFDPVKKRFKHYVHNPNDTLSLSTNELNTMYQDQCGKLWIGTTRGMDSYNKSGDYFEHYTSLENYNITGILDDNSGNLWLKVDKGLVHFNPVSGKQKLFDHYDGLYRHQSWEHGFCKNKKGEIIFGGLGGINIIIPDNLLLNPNSPPVQLTDFRIFNKTVPIGPDSPLKKSIVATDTICLEHSESVYTFTFAALDYSNPTINQYAYKMGHVNPEWVFTDATNRTATYTNLNPGTYTFTVKASNNDGVWNERGRSVKIIILPPWWKTYWAFAGYILLTLLLFHYVRQYDRKRQRLKHDLELESVHAKNLEELNQAKSRFFANISHEFRTPLTLIEGPIRQLAEGKITGSIKEQYELILRNTHRLLNLVNQLLYLSKIDAGRMELKTSLVNVVPLLKGITMTFHSTLRRKNISLECVTESDEIYLFLDLNKFETIIMNLLSNACKFTTEGGKIMVDIRSNPKSAPRSGFNASFPQNSHSESGIDHKNDHIIISITNTGPVISPAHIERIFDRFYQVNSSNAGEDKGSGIGLTLSRELIEMHHGRIEVTSNETDGTTFKITFPTGREHLKDEQISQLSSADILLEKPFAEETRIRPTTEVEALRTDKPLILIVEDNIDVRHFIRSGMGESYQYIEAGDGEQGFEKAASEIPDLIISDVMMPIMDGYKFCKKIKQDERTSHIPLVLLTARADIEDKINGLETGADDYIAKPFRLDELLLRVHNLIEQRNRLRDRFMKEFNLQTANTSLTSRDEKFLKRSIEIVETRMSDPDFDVTDFIEDIHLSRSVLYRKMKALTNQSVKQFIRTIRLKRAALILQKGSVSVSEAAYEAGFNNLSYFAECFRKQFGISPSQFSHQHHIIH